MESNGNAAYYQNGFYSALADCSLKKLRWFYWSVGSSFADELFI